MILCCCCRVSYQLQELNIQSQSGRLGLHCALLLLIIVFIIAVEIFNLTKIRGKKFTIHI